jgi:hypothetical protein
MATVGSFHSKKERNASIEMDHTLYADGFDQAIIGLCIECSPARVVYDKQKMVEILMKEDEMSEEDAIDFLEYNTWNAYVGEGTPIYVTVMSKQEIDDTVQA